MKTAKDVVNEYKKIGLTEKFCTVPFTTILLEPDGLVGACRQKGCEFPIGKLQDNTIDEIWNGESIKRWRREFLEGKPVTCAKEVRHIQCHTCPEYNYLLPHVELSEVQTRKPSRIAFNLNGKCNLECQMCHIWQKPNGFYDQIGFWEKLEELVTDLQEVELLSGEPFIQKDTYKLIDQISNLRPSCRWTITTNANWKLTDFVKEKLDKIKIRNLIVSLDSLVPQNYQKIRKKGNLELALTTLDDLMAYDKDRIARGIGTMNIRVNFLVQKDNWQELGSFQEFKNRKGVEIFRTFLLEPFEHSLLSLPESGKQEVLDYYLENLKPEQMNLRIILPLLDSVHPIHKAQFFEKMAGSL